MIRILILIRFIDSVNALVDVFGVKGGIDHFIEYAVRIQRPGGKIKGQSGYRQHQDKQVPHYHEVYKIHGERTDEQKHEYQAYRRRLPFRNYRLLRTAYFVNLRLERADIYFLCLFYAQNGLFSLPAHTPLYNG